MGDEKKSDTEKEQKSGLPQMSAMHVVIAIAVIVIAVIFIAKFGFNMDLISPSSGEMAIVKRPVVTPARTLDQPGVVRPERTRPPTLPTEVTCGDTTSDPGNCGACGNVCSVNSARKNVAEYGCSNSKCTITSCQPGYGDCASQGTTDINSDGCETNLLTGQSWIYNVNDQYVGQSGSGKNYLLNPKNCGTCGNSCSDPSGNVFSICENGVCRKVCRGPWLDCNNNMADACEQRWNDDNCGACGAKCPTNSVCNSGCCQLKLYPERSVADSLGGTCRTSW